MNFLEQILSSLGYVKSTKVDEAHKRITDLEDILQICKEEIRERANKLTKTTIEYEEYKVDAQKALDFCEVSVKKLKTVYAPKKKITHAWNNGKTITQLPIQNFIQPNCVEIHELLRKKKLYLNQNKLPLNEYIPRLYYNLKTLVPSYTSDTAQFGLKEVWNTISQALQTKQSDCEEMSFMLCSGFRAAGFTPDRVLVVIGLAFAVIGHATFVFKDEVGVWRNLNSTTMLKGVKSLEEFPELGVKETKEIGGNLQTDIWNLSIIDYGFNDIVTIENPKELDIEQFKVL